MVVSVEYCWLIFSEGVVHGGGFVGIPGGSRPQMCETSSTSRPRCTLMEERCFTPRLGTSDGWGRKHAYIYMYTCTAHTSLRLVISVVCT